MQVEEEVADALVDESAPPDEALMHSLTLAPSGLDARAAAGLVSGGEAPCVRFGIARRSARRSPRSLARDPRVFVMGEEVCHYNGASDLISLALRDKRVVDAPIAEAGFAGIGVGAAMVSWVRSSSSRRNFSAVAFDQILNNAAKLTR